jgi:hypothetical protein
MTDTPRASAQGNYPGWARNWRPRTKHDTRALELYDNATISGIVDVLPGFAEGADQDVLAGLIRQWASQWIAIRRGASRDTAAHVCAKLEILAAKWQEAATAAEELSCIAKGWMAELRPVGDSARLDDYARNLDYVLSAPSAARELAGLAGKAANAVKISHPSDAELRWAIKQLCWIYEIVTGRAPRRLVHPYGRRNGGPFEAFVATGAGDSARSKAGRRATTGAAVSAFPATRTSRPAGNIRSSARVAARLPPEPPRG